MRYWISSLFLSGILFAHFPLVPASAGHIDFITAGPFNLSSSNSTPVTDSPTDAASILGGTRDVTLVRNGGFGGTITAQTVFSTGSGVIDVMNSTVSAGRLTLNYDGFDDQDFAAFWDAFVIDVPVLEQSGGIGDGEIDISITVENEGGSVTTPLGSIPGDGTRFENPGVFVFEFDDPKFSGFDFSNVDRVQFDFQTAIIGSDFQIASITRRDINVVPEPSAAGLLLLSIPWISTRRRSRKG